MLRILKEWLIILSISYKKGIPVRMLLWSSHSNAYLCFNKFTDRYHIGLVIWDKEPLLSFLHEYGHWWDFKRDDDTRRACGMNSSHEESLYQELLASRFALRAAKSLNMYKKSDSATVLKWFVSYIINYQKYSYITAKEAGEHYRRAAKAFL